MPSPNVEPGSAGQATSVPASEKWAAASRTLFYRTSESPRIYCGDGPIKRDVLPRCASLLRSFTPTVWASNTHMQTVLGLLRKLSIRNIYTRQLVICSDGGTVGLDWYRNCCAPSCSLASTTPVVMIMHGINGGSHEGYCKWACMAALEKGWRAVVLNYRGCNGLTLTSPRGYTATLTDDVRFAIEAIKGPWSDSWLKPAVAVLLCGSILLGGLVPNHELAALLGASAPYSVVRPFVPRLSGALPYRRYPGAPVCAVAYSLGSLILTKYLAEADSGLQGPGPEGSGLLATCMVSSPVCLFNSISNLSKPWRMTFLYNLAVAFKLREFIAEHRSEIQHDSVLDVDHAMRAWTVQEVEDAGLALSYGYRSRQEYYENASSLPYLPAIRTPTMLLVSQDDPFLGVVPDLECEANPYLLLTVTQRGGHLGFTHGLWPLGPSYMDTAVMEFLEAVMMSHVAVLPPSQQPADTGTSNDPVASPLLGDTLNIKRETSSIAALQSAPPQGQLQDGQGLRQYGPCRWAPVQGLDPAGRQQEGMAGGRGGDLAHVAPGSKGSGLEELQLGGRPPIVTAVGKGAGLNSSPCLGCDKEERPSTISAMHRSRPGLGGTPTAVGEGASLWGECAPPAQPGVPSGAGARVAFGRWWPRQEASTRLGVRSRL